MKAPKSWSWLGKLDAGTLKLKVAASIVAISPSTCCSEAEQCNRHTDLTVA